MATPPPPPLPPAPDDASVVASVTPPAAAAAAAAPPIATPGTPPRARELLRTPGMRLALLLCGTAAALLGSGLCALRLKTLDGERMALRAVAAAQAAQADSTLAIAEAVLRDTRADLANGYLQPEQTQAQPVLHARVGALPMFRALLLLDAQGRPVASSRPGLPSPPPDGPPLTERDFFVAARAGGAPQLFVGLPTLSPHDGQPALGVSMAWDDAQGRFGGVMILVADAGALDGSFTRTRPVDDLSLSLLRRDGHCVSDGSGQLPGSRTPAPDTLQALWQAGAGAGPAQWQTLTDGHERLVAVQALRQQQLLVVVSRDADKVLAEWRALSWGVGVFATLALGASLLLSWRHAAEAARRRASEAALADEQARQQRASKLESLGTLAGGVAHDFNNILASVIGHAELARDAALPGSAQARWLDQVLKAGERGRQLVSRILLFSRGGNRPHSVFRAQPVVEEALQALTASLPAAVQLHTELRAPQAALQGDPSQLHEAVLNLCHNAVQAMPGGGTLRLTLRDQTLAQTATLALRTGPLPPGRYLCLAVSDSGAGMSPEVMARIFEPFFTTKPPRAGTGLGLAMVHGVVTELGGGIAVDSSPGQGARFTLYLPCGDVPAALLAAAAPPAPAPALPLGQGQCILVVDDEPGLVEMTEELLAGLGYDAYGLSSADEALRQLQADPQRFDLLLTDESMPGLCGTELARAVCALRPDLPILLASGYGGAQLNARAQACGIRHVVSKPLDRTALARAVAAALAAAAAGPCASGPDEDAAAALRLNPPA